MAKKVLCVGLVCVDLIQTCDEYPKEDSDRRSIDCRWQRGGNASNNCTVLAQLGSDCEFFGSVSNTVFWQFIKKDFEKYSIDIQHCIMHENKEFPLSTVIINLKNGSRTIVHSNKQWPEITFEDFIKLNMSDYSWIHFEGRNIDELLKMMVYVSDYNSNGCLSPVKVSLEIEKPNSDLLNLAPLADVVFIGKDFAVHYGWVNMEDAVDVMKFYIKSSASVICTWGDKGAAMSIPEVGGGRLVVNCPGFNPPGSGPLDSLGAGDAFCAAILHRLISNLPDNSVPTSQDLKIACQMAAAKLSVEGLDGLADIYSNITSNMV